MCGFVTVLSYNDRILEAARLATECVPLIESIGNPALIITLLLPKWQAGEVVETLRLAQRAIDFLDGNPIKGDLGIGSPLAVAQMYRGAAELALGMPGFRDHFDEALATARPVSPISFALVVVVKYYGIALGVYLPDDAALRDTADALALAQKSADPWTLACALMARGSTLVHRDGPESEAGYDLLAQVRDMALAHQFALLAVPFVDIHMAIRKAHQADVDGAIELGRAALDNLLASGDMLFRWLATTTLVEALLRRGADGDIAEAHGVVRPRMRYHCGIRRPPKGGGSARNSSDHGGRYRIRTCVGFRRRIYSPLPLAARATCRVAPGRGPAWCD
jgi:adenylate cyclase